MSMSDLYGSGPTYSVSLEHVRWGRFSVVAAGANEVDPSEVMFIQTSISLGDPEQAPLVEQLAPVRETIDPELLGFENLIQRDLDDARVSNALIPYLLDQGSGMVRMFPSILVLLLPTQHERIEKFYLPRQNLDPVPAGALDVVSMAYGDGDRKWSFEFSRRRTKAGSYVPYGAALRVNPQHCKFAIVDGQHRAMALLALWRNLTKWPDAGKPFKDFYANHHREKLLKVDLSGLSLPVTICFFPQLHAGNPDVVARDQSVVKAARTLFLDVNKSAKPPSKARQVLLDDVRVTSDFVRAIMTTIKDQESSAGKLRLWNLYYDQAEDNEAALPKIAVTSVLHLQYMVRMLLLGARPHNGERLVTRADFSIYNPATQDNNRTLVEMLRWEQAFGNQAVSWKDESVPLEFRPKVVKGFMDTWGGVALDFLEHFPAFEALADAASQSRTNLQQSVADEDPLVLRMLFEGQGVRAVHDAIRDQMDTEAGEKHPYPDGTKTVFKKQGKRLEEVEGRAMDRAAELFWGQGKPWPTWLSADDKLKLVQTFTTALGLRLFKTKAFQVGVMMAIGHVERKLPEEHRPLFWSAQVPAMLLAQLAAYFRPDGFPGNGLGTEKAQVWAQNTIANDRIGGFVERGLYRHVREVLGGELRDGRWQLAKYCVMEMFLSGVPEVVKTRDAWKSRVVIAAPSEVESLLVDVDQICREAVWRYRDQLLAAELDNLRLRHRRETGHEATDEKMQEFWSSACAQLAQKLQFSMNISPEDVRKLTTRLRGGAEQIAAEDARTTSEDAAS